MYIGTIKMFYGVGRTGIVKKLGKINIIRRKCSKLSYIHNIGEEPLKPLTFGGLLEKTCQNHGNTEAIVSCHQNIRLTFQEVLNQADRLAAGFRTIGLEYGDRLGLWAPNLVEWYIGKMACARSGLIMVAINPAYQPKEIEYCINKVGIKAIICPDQHKKQHFYEILQSVAPELSQSEPGNLKSSAVPSLRSIVTISDESLNGTFNYNEILDLGTKERVEAIKNFQKHIKIDDAFNIQFTSGTTGKPKAAVLSHFHMVNNGYFIGKRNELGLKQHKICVQVPLFHAFGTVITITAALHYGATLVLPAASHDPDKTLTSIKKEECSIIHGTPTMYVDLINKQLERKESLKAEIAVTGGASCSPQLFKQMLDVLNVKKVKSVYGLSETTAVVFQSLYNDDEDKSTTTVGNISEQTEAKVVDPNGNIVPLGTAGELCLRGYFTMLGYYEDEEKTKEMISPDKWLKTGDQFVLDEHGYGRVVGRIKEMIIRGGENIFPKEIEDFLNTHSDILETYVIGVPNERLGEEVCACIRTKTGSNVTLENLKSFCQGTLSHFKIPSILKIVEHFPKTTSGKVQKFKLLEMVEKK